MTYAWDIEIPANTLAANPVTRTLKLTFGVITKIEIKYPSGCHGLVKCVLTRGGILRVAPANPDQYVTGDDEPVSWRLFHVIDDTPTELYFSGCSPGTTYAHTVTVRIELLPRWVAFFMNAPEFLKRIAKRLGLV